PLVPTPAPPVPDPDVPMGEGPPEVEGEGAPDAPLPEVPEVPETERFDELDPSASAAPRLLKTGSRGNGGAVRTADGFNPAAAAHRDAPPLEALRDYCIVALHDHRFARASAEYATLYKGRTYFFESAEAQSR